MKRKDLGQHFLINKQIIQDELKYAELTNTDIVLEIGPGKGALTIPLAEKVDHVIAIEKDPILYKTLLPQLPENVTLICSDVLTYNFQTLPHITKVVANLPYKISSPITFKLLTLDIEKAILLYQKEFAERMVALPNTPNYCRLSVAVYYYTICKILQTVPPTSFSPQPRIDSCLVEIIPRNTPPFNTKDETFFFQVVKDLFIHRRKKIGTVIKKQYSISQSIPYADKRVETLSPEQIAELSDALFPYQKEEPVGRKL